MVIWCIIIAVTCIIFQCHNHYRVNKMIKNCEYRTEAMLARHEIIVTRLYEMNNLEENSCLLTYDQLLEEENSIK